MNEQFLYFLLDKDGRSYYQAANGSIQSQAKPRPLQNKPIGWREIELSFDMVDKYFSRKKALSIPLQYVLDGADILRWLLYRGRGFNEQVYCVIVKYNPEFVDVDGKEGIYELEYRAQIDMLNNVVDDVKLGVTVNAKEGGLQADWDANEDVTYELPLTDNLALFDGVTLFDKYKYTSYDFDLGFGVWIIPMVFGSNEGDSVGVISGTQSPEKIILTGGHTVQEYVSGSSNNIFETINPLHVDHAKINFSYTVKSVGSVPTTVDLYLIVNVTDISFNYVNLSANTMPHDVAGNTYTYSFDVPLDLIRSDKVFLAATVKSPGFGDYVITVNGRTTAEISFTSINDPSIANFLKPLEIANQIVKKWNPAYSVVSDHLSQFDNIVATSGQSLRGLTGSVLKTSFADFFEAYNDLKCLEANAIGNVLYIEPRKEKYASNSNTTIFDLGTVTDLKISPEPAKVIKTIKTGYPKQAYDERNGRYEFNSENEFQTTANAKGEISLIGKYRGDPYGIEFIRGKLNNKDTTDAKSDNECFLVNVTAQEQITGDVNFTYTGENKTIKLEGQAGNVGFFPVGKNFVTKTQFSSEFNNYLFTVVSATVDVDDLNIAVKEAAPAALAILTVNIIFPYKLTRKVYDTQPVGIITPNIDGPGALFNIEEMTPKRKLLAWGSWFRSVLQQLAGDKISFQTADKNGLLSTTLNGVTIAENTDIAINSLDPAFFLNYTASFTGIVPLRFAKTLTNLNAAGNVLVSYNGFQLSLLPIGKMASKPATNDAQQWQLLIGANNNLKTLYELSQDGLYISDGMDNTLRLSPLNPVHFIFVEKTLNPRYSYKDIFDDWEHLRNEQFAVQPQYLQKWASTDTVKLQGIANGMTQVELFLFKAIPYKRSGLYVWQQVDIITSTIVANTAVRSPSSLLEIDLSVNNYDEGFYCYELRANGVRLAISAIQHFADRHEGTYIIDYWNSKNVSNAYFAAWRPMIRVEAMFGTEKADGSSVDYQDETRLETLHYDTFTTKRITFGFPYGIPEWMQIKLNYILRLDRTDVEGTRYTLSSDAKWDISERNGYPHNMYGIDLRRTSNVFDFAITDAGTEGGRSMIATADAEAFGMGSGIVTIEPGG